VHLDGDAAVAAVRAPCSIICKLHAHYALHYRMQFVLAPHCTCTCTCTYTCTCTCTYVRRVHTIVLETRKYLYGTCTRTCTRTCTLQVLACFKDDGQAPLQPGQLRHRLWPAAAQGPSSSPARPAAPPPLACRCARSTRSLAPAVALTPALYSPNPSPNPNPNSSPMQPQP